VPEIINKAKIIASPDSNVAKSTLLTISEAETQLKTLIAQDYQLGVKASETKSKALKIIVECAKQFINSPRQYNQVRVGLLTLYNNAYVVHVENMKTLNRSLMVELAKKKMINSRGEITFENTTYQLRVDGLLGDKQVRPTDLLTNVQFRGLRSEIRVAVPSIRNYEKLVRERYLELATKSATVEGQSLRVRAEVQVRYEETQKDLQKVEFSGNDLWWISSHVNCSERCQKWQGRLYSKSGDSGVIKGVNYTPLQEALDANDGNSIINGYNCRHYLIAYFDGSTPPRDYNATEIAKQREIDAKQRYYESQIRLKKQEEAVNRATGNKEYADKLNDRWKKQLASYQQLSLRNGRPVQMWRTRLFRQSNSLVPDDEQE
jgi:hypothetical protein